MQFADLSSRERKQVLDYFASHLPSPEVAEVLGELPIFPTLAGSPVALRGTGNPRAAVMAQAEPHGVCSEAVLRDLFPSAPSRHPDILVRPHRSHQSTRSFFCQCKSLHFFENDSSQAFHSGR